MRLVLNGFGSKPTLSIVFVLFAAFAIAGCRDASKEVSAPKREKRAKPVVSQLFSWPRDLDAALIEARETDRPLLVVSIVGNLQEHC